jgi:multidrug efflux pump subunit AcrA (membrane-fusion protein)
MDKQMRIIMVAILVVLALVAIAYWYWRKYDNATLAVSAVAYKADGTVTVTATNKATGKATGKNDPSSWAGKKIHVYTKSLGKISSTVAAVSSANGTLVIQTAPGAYMGSAAYSASQGDTAHVVLKY